MWPFLCLVLAAFALFLWRRSRRLERLVEDVSCSIEEKRAFLFEESSLLTSSENYVRLRRAWQKSLDEMDRLRRERTERLREIDATLGRLRDYTLLIDRNHEILFSNPAAREGLSNGAPLEGRRLEAVLRSVELLDFTQLLIEGEDAAPVEFSLHQEGRDARLEVSGAQVTKIREDESNAYLLLFRDVTEVRRLERLRKDFVSDVSHELRTPVTLLKGFSDAVLEAEHEELSPERLAGFIRKINRNADRLHALIEDLLNLSELEAESPRLNLSNSRLADVIPGVVEFLSDRPHVNTDKLRLELAEEEDGFPFDAVKVGIAMQNLVENAFKYAGDFTHVTIRTGLSEDGAFATCSVSDDGDGIPAKHLPRLFERFYVVNKGRSREKGGTGLGLSIVKHVAEAHGGSAKVESKPTKGSTFSFSLPRS